MYDGLDAAHLMTATGETCRTEYRGIMIFFSSARRRHSTPLRGILQIDADFINIWKALSSGARESELAVARDCVEGGLCSSAHSADRASVSPQSGINEVSFVANATLSRSS